MIFSWRKVAAFFALALAAAWLLYPNDYFVGLMKRQRPDREPAARSLERYLEKRPRHRDAAFALADLKESTAEPERAAERLAALYASRPGDLVTGRKWLELLERSGDFAAAQAARWRLYEDLRGRRPRDSRTVEELLYAYYQRALLEEDLPGQEKALRALMAAASSPESYRHELLSLYAEARRWRPMMELLEERLRDAPADLPARLRMAEVLRAQGRLEEALARLDQGLRLKPEEPALLEARVSALESAGRFGEALAGLRRLAELRPSDRRLLKRLAYDSLMAGDLAGAERSYVRLTEEDPSDRRTWLEAFYGFEKAGRPRDAARWLERAAAALPEDLEIGSALARNRLAAGDLEGAERAYAALLARRPRDRKLWMERVYAGYDRGRTERARELLEQFTRLFPEDAEGHELGAHLLESAGRREEAADLLAAYARRRPDDEKAARKLADLLGDLGRHAQAEELARRRREALPADPFWIVMLARSLQAQGRGKEAVARYEEWLKAEGEKPETLLEAGREAHFAGEQEAARRLLLRARERSPEDGEAAYFLSETEAAASRPAEARRWAKAALGSPLGRGPEGERRRLRLEGRLGWSPELDRRWRARADADPRDPAPLLEWMEGRLQNGLEAREPLALFNERFPDRKAPHALPLAEAHLRSGDWDQASRLLAEAPPPAGGAEAGFRGELMRQIAERYGRRFGPAFLYESLPGQSRLETGLGWSGPLARAWRLDADWRHGEYRASGRPDAGFETGRALLGWGGPEGPGAGLELGASAGGPADRLWPGASLSWRGKAFSAEAGHRHRRSWTEYAQAAVAGADAQESWGGFEARPLDRLYLGGRYQYNHYRAGGARAWRSQLVPELGWTLSEEPRLAALYQFVFDEADGQEAFFERVELIRRARAHYLGLGWSGRWGKAGRLEAYVYNGEDSGRGLDFLRGELFGASAGAGWSFGRSWEAALRYEYGRQNPAGVAGERHEVSGSLRWRWSFDEKKDLPDR